MANDWSVQLPLSELLKLKAQPETIEALKAENKQLKEQMEALRNLFTDVCIQFGDLRKEIQRR